MIRTFTFIFLFIGSIGMSAQDRLLAAYRTATDVRSGKEGAFRRVTRASLNVTGIDKVLVVASFDTKYNRTSTTRDGIYKLSDGNSESGSMILSLRNSGGLDKGIGTLVHIFDASTLSGRVSYDLRHSSSTNRIVISSGTIVAIGLTTSESGVEISHDFVNSSTPVSTSSTLGAWRRVSRVRINGIILVEEGDVYVSASVNSVADGSGAGEWKLQYRSNNFNWTDFGPTTSRSFTSDASYGISTLSYVLQDLPADDYSFRLMHRQTEGNPGDLTTYTAQLAACALVYEALDGITREFPSFSTQKLSTSTTSPTMSPVFNHSIDPSNVTDLFLQAQYVMTADASLDAAAYDLSIDQSILDGTDQLRYISSTEVGNGGSVGLGTSLLPGTSYGISLRHQSVTGINLTTQNATLSGFQLTSVGNSVWKGGALLPTDWDQNDNWIGEVPGSRENAIIPDGAASYPVLQAATECQDLSLRAGGTLTLGSTSSLTINGVSEFDGTLTVLSDQTGTGSLIVLGPSTGNITYNSHLAANRWYIVSTPVTGQNIQSFLHPDANNHIPYSNSFEAYGLTDYSELDNSWNPFFTSSTPGTFNTGEGYLMRRESPDGSVSYLGELVESDFQYGISASVSGWNAVGNPFPSSLGVTSDATTDENFLTVNLDQLDPNYGVLYLWDEQIDYSGTQNYYKVIGNAGYIDSYNYEELQMDYQQAGQGFLVKSVDGGGILRFTKAMQAHQNSTGMVKSAGKSWDGFKLVATHGERSESAIICFHEEMSPGLDPSYDAGLLNSKPEFSVYTRLLEEDPGIGFKIQCLPYQSTTELVIPVGMDLLSGGEVSFSADGVLLPSTHQIFLEDRSTGRVTDITTQGSSYGVVVEENTQDTGRFFLRIKDPNVTTGDYRHPEAAPFQAYYLHSSITILGKVGEGATAFIFDMSGRNLGRYHLQMGNRHTIPVPSLEEGLYLVAVIDGRKRSVLKILKN
ncbi:MAG: hypothetical protein DRI98_08340 [Bacteroidetes bacterium]|nr:MAG: hypothetical protein DRI98_08340 [Bacteroidota bacterium]